YCSNLVSQTCTRVLVLARLELGILRAKTNGPAHSTTDYSAYLRELQIQQRAKLLELACDVTDAYGAVVCWAVGVPLIDEVSGTDRKSIPAVRISNFKSGTWDRFRLGCEQLNPAICGFNDRQERHRAVLYGHFHGQ